MNVLITGVSGWLGRRLLELLREGHCAQRKLGKLNIRCLLLKNSDVEFARHLVKKFNVSVISGDLKERNTLKNAVEGIDVVFHLAGVTWAHRVKDYFQINTLGTENLITVSVQKKVKRFIYISSESVSGVKRDYSGKAIESDKPSPYCSYAFSKHQAEMAVNRIARSEGIETVILRPSVFYGPLMPADQVRFFRMIKNGRPVIFGNGKNLRNMVYIDNVVEAVLLSAQVKEAAGNTYFIADNEPHTTYEIYKMISEEIKGKDLRPVYIPDIFCDACYFLDKSLQYFGLHSSLIHVAAFMNKNVVCSIDKAKNELGYNPAVRLREGIKKSLKWCRDNNIKL
ncbi:MAG: NAD-dependent epimerase/dehydratase family protein [Candidatus Omnitrophica bacterium]|nr:NAD-dependent epimerase/dehydratase family protein [Candidatus Omnitrophota bacterium]